MRKSDIQSMADIARLILEGTADAENLNNTADHLYNQLGQNLRLNDYKDGSKNIVMFYTKKPSDTENDVLHNAAGPAVIFANAQGEYDKKDPQLAFYFLNNEKLNPDDTRFQDAYQADAGKNIDDSLEPEAKGVFNNPAAGW